MNIDMNIKDLMLTIESDCDNAWDYISAPTTDSIESGLVDFDSMEAMLDSDYMHFHIACCQIFNKYLKMGYNYIRLRAIFRYLDIEL